MFVTSWRSVIRSQCPWPFAVLTALAASLALSAQGQIIYQEGFNDDGEKANPPRYTTLGRDVYEVARITAELALTDQLGPIYWAHNAEVSFAGVPGPTPGRRMIMAWDATIDASTASEDYLKLFESSVKWMVNNKANAKIVVGSTVAGIGVLGDRLTAAGYTLVDDDITVAEDQLPTAGDLFIHGPGTPGSRGATAKMPVIAMVSTDHDDLLVSSIGTATLFEASQGTIVTPAHPAAGGKTGSFTVATGAFTWQLLGDVLPENAIVVANFARSIPPTAATLAEVDSMVAGTKSSDKATAQVTSLDFADASPGDWQDQENPIPGGAVGVWGLRATGKIKVNAAGKFSFALAQDDGARLRIDKDKNGFTDADNVIVEDAAGAHRAKFADVTFDAAGTFDFEVTVFNSGGGGDVEVSISTKAGGGDTSAVNSGSWILLSQTAGDISLDGVIATTSYVPTGAQVDQTLPLIVLLNAPNDTPPGTVFGGGPFTGFEGTGFFGMSGGNKWPYPDGRGDRTLTLRPVDVAGKTDVKVTVALAATFLDFETTDYLDIVAFPNGLTGPEVVLAHYTVPDASRKYFVDATHGNANRLGLKFQDVTYDIPAGATDLVIEFRAATTWWNEIAVFDNVRIHSGPLVGQGTPGQPVDFKQTVKGYQDDFTGATRDPNWKVRGPGGDLYKQEDGLLRVTVRTADPNHLLYEAAGYNDSVQEVLARIRVTAFPTAEGDASRAGIGVAVQTTPAAELSRGINLHFRNFTADGVTGKQFKLLDDARAWGPAGLKDAWPINTWYWMRLRHDPNANGGTDDVFGKVWLADGQTDEPADWQLKWNYIPTRTARKGFAGLTGSSIDGLGSFEVDYILIKADGLPEITANWALTGPAPTTAKFTAIRVVSATQIELEWVGAGNLESANDLGGPWTLVANSSSPKKVSSSGTTKFYRLRQ